MKIYLIIFLSVLLTNNLFASQTELFFVGSVNQKIPCKQKDFFLKKGDTLRLYPVLKVDDIFFSSIDSFYADDVLIHAAKKISSQIVVDWYQIQPELQEYSNLWEKGNADKGFIHVEPIHYEKKLLNGYIKQIFWDFPPSSDEDDFGTYYITAETTLNGKIINAIEASFLEDSPLCQKFPFKIIQIIYRKDDTYIGLLSELYNTPFIIAPKTTLDGFQETDSRMGSDCAAFAIYGKRRQGFSVPYCGPRRIYKYLSEIGKGYFWPKKMLNTEVYVNRKSQFIKVGSHGIQSGDIIHFGEQVSVFYKDLGIKGILDKDDLLLQCYKTAPYITTMEKSGFYSLPIRVFKWKNELRKATSQSYFTMCSSD